MDEEIARAGRRWRTTMRYRLGIEPLPHLYVCRGECGLPDHGIGVHPHRAEDSRDRGEPDLPVPEMTFEEAVKVLTEQPPSSGWR
jgi:hypothetical protein